MKWNSKKVLVTGAGGFIGSHLAERLVREGAIVRAMVHYNALGKRGWLEDSPLRAEMEIVAGDVTDRDSTVRSVQGCEVVFHLAALIAIPYSYQAPASYVRTNVEGTLNILSASRDAGTPRVLCTSTSEVYGTARYAPIDEAHPLQGQSPYSASKIGADKMAEAFHASFGLPVTVVRPFNTFGPRQSARAVIPTIIGQLLNGSEVKLGNLHPTRDLNFVDNTVDAFLCAASHTGIAGQTVHFGSGREISIGDLAAVIAGLMGKAPVLAHQEERLRPAASEVERLIADNRRATEWLGWMPAISLEEGLSRTIAWFQQHGASEQPDRYVI